ncbi:hypothetical protein AB0H12_38225 [Actinosynnema sp. NPDC023794]
MELGPVLSAHLLSRFAVMVGRSPAVPTSMSDSASRPGGSARSTEAPSSKKSSTWTE